MLLACWSVKGGSGTTVVAAGLALVLARGTPHGALLVDLAGDLPWALGAPSTAGPGVFDWIAAGPSVAADALTRLEIDVGGGVGLVPAGGEDGTTELGAAVDASGRDRVVAALRRQEDRPTVIDAGRPTRGSVAAAVVEAADQSLLVVRPCYLALRRAVASSYRPTGVVLTDEPHRALGPSDVEAALGVPVVAVVPDRPDVARAVDAGMLAGRLPRVLATALRGAA